MVIAGLAPSTTPPETDTGSISTQAFCGLNGVSRIEGVDSPQAVPAACDMRWGAAKRRDYKQDLIRSATRKLREIPGLARAGNTSSRLQLDIPLIKTARH